MNWYQTELVDTGRAGAVWALIGFLLTIVIVRLITRRIRSKKNKPVDPDSKGGGFSDIYIAGVHVHHQVWGILLILVAGIMEIRYDPESPWSEILGALFGIGAALALDEFALWFHLDDVYWGENGRKSVDAILIGAVIGAVLLMQATPFGVEDDGETGPWLYVVTICINLAFAAVCFVKGKIATGLIGIVVPLVAMVGAFRLAKPASVWARRRYRDKKLGRSRQRFDVDYQRRRDRLRDLIGGKPDPAAGDPQPDLPTGPHTP